MKKTISEKLGLNFKTLRIEKGLSQGEIAEAIGVSRSYISNIENGKVNPTLSTIEKLAEIIGVSIGKLANNKNVVEADRKKFPPKIEMLIDEVKKAGRIARDSFLNNETIYFKDKINKSDIVTDIDLRAEKILTRAIGRYFPEVEIKSEESFNGKLLNFEKESNIAVVDPLDGTANFFTNIPYFCISVFLNSDKDGAFGIIYAPITELLLVGDFNKLELRQNEKITVINSKSKSADSEKRASLKDVTCAIISDYNIPSSVAEPFIHYLYACGAKRVLSHWSPSHDYMNLIMNKYECVISLSNPSFSEAAGLFFVKQSKNHALKSIKKNILGKKYLISVSANKKYTRLTNNLINNYKPA